MWPGAERGPRFDLHRASGARGWQRGYRPTFADGVTIATTPVPGGPTVKVRDWDNYTRAGSRIAEPLAPAQIVEFGDFQYPYCRTFDNQLSEVRQRCCSDVALTYVEFPLSNLRFAAAAARAAECAGHQGHFAEMHDVL